MLSNVGCRHAASSQTRAVEPALAPASKESVVPVEVKGERVRMLSTPLEALGP